MKQYQRIRKAIRESMTDELVTLHCKAEGPVSVGGLLAYVNEQHGEAEKVPITLAEIRESIDRLVNEDTLEPYDESTWW